MELPDDVLRLVREYAKPSERYKVGKRVLVIMERGKPLGPIRKELNTAVRFHYEAFQQLFLTLEKSYAELSVAVDAVMRDDTTIYTVSQLRMEYYRKRQDFTYVECDLMNLLYMKCNMIHELECRSP
jgi:hypothetical protein